MPFWARFEEIANDPSRWRFRHDLFPNCQVASLRRHMIFFRIRGRQVQVVRILHSAMDFPLHLPD